MNSSKIGFRVGVFIGAIYAIYLSTKEDRLLPVSVISAFSVWTCGIIGEALGEAISGDFPEK